MGRGNFYENFRYFRSSVSHSLSPKMHNAALEAVGLEKELIYLKFDILPHDLKTAINALKVLNAKGVNITIPYKEAVIPFLDGLDMSAQAVNGVNVIVNDNGRLIGYNTDGIGFIRSLKEESGVNPRGKSPGIRGGGAAKSVCAALRSRNKRNCHCEPNHRTGGIRRGNSKENWVQGSHL